MSETGQKENHQFATDNAKLLKLMIHSLYSNKEIFLRELVSNAADAADKLRFKALSDDNLYEGDGDLRVRVSCDKENNTVTISDNGIGMTHDQIVDHLGTIAKSGTSEFFSQLSGDEASDSQLIGQFGVGFYSAFIVADSVTVRSRGAGVDASAGVEWSSDGEGEFTTTAIEKANRGTDIILHLKEEESEFADDWRLKSIVTKYSDHISVSVEMLTPEVPAVEAVAEAKDEEGNVTTPAIEARDAVPALWEPVNKATALWTREKSEVSDEEYKEFYKHVSHDFGDPLLWEHNKVEGKTEYTSLLYVPSKAPFDMHNREKQHGLKLFVQRVFIMDDCDELMPEWLNMVKGVVDSEDLPLNISRETLQQNKILRVIKKNLVKKCLEMFAEIAEKKDDYKKFYEQFGKCLKLGVHEDSTNRTKVAELLRFHTSKSGDELIGLKEYVDRMKEGQNDIYYITGESIAAVSSSPFLETLRKKGLEVLYMTDPIDEYAVQQLKEFDGKKLKSTTKEGLDIDDEDEKKKFEELKAEFEPLTKLMKEVLGDKTEKVMVSSRMADSPCVLTTSEHGWSANMERIMKAQALRDNSMTSYMVSKKTMEINPKHSIMLELRKKAAADKSDKTVKDLIWLLFDTSLLTSGFNLDEPTQFAGRIHRMIKLGLSIDDDDDLGADDDLPPLEEVEGAADEASKMEEVD